MDRKFKGAGLVVLALLPLLIAASGGFPSRPIFQRVTIGNGGAVLTNSGTSLLVNGSPIGQTAIGGTLVNVSTADVSRASTTTRTCQTDLTISTGLQSTGFYAITAHVPWDQQGSTANGLAVNIDVGGSGGTILMDNGNFTETVNTTTGNVAPLANSISGITQFVYTHGTAGQTRELNFTGTLNIIGVTSPTVCVSWAQVASNATATRVQRGSWIKATRLN